MSNGGTEELRLKNRGKPQRNSTISNRGGSSSSRFSERAEKFSRGCSNKDPPHLLSSAQGKRLGREERELLGRCTVTGYVKRVRLVQNYTVQIRNRPGKFIIWLITALIRLRVDYGLGQKIYKY